MSAPIKQSIVGTKEEEWGVSQINPWPYPWQVPHKTLKTLCQSSQTASVADHDVSPASDEHNETEDSGGISQDATLRSASLVIDHEVQSSRDHDTPESHAMKLKRSQHN